MSYTKTITSFFLFLCAFCFRSESQDLLKIRPISTVGNDYNWAAAIDSDSSIYLSFSLYPSNKDSVNINNEIFYDSLLDGSFLVKLDVKRNVLWMKETPYIIQNIEVASTNDIIVSGFASHTFYVSRLSPSGTTLWEVSEGTSSSMISYDMMLDESDNIYITGNAKDWEIFGLRINNDGCCLDHDFLAKFNSSGNLSWIKASSPDKQGYGRSLTKDDSGNVYLLGSFTHSLSFGGFSLGNTGGYENSYLAKLSSSGNVLNVVGFGGNNGHLNISNISWHNNNNILFAGTFTRTVQVGDSTITSYGKSDLIYGSMTSLGDINWFNHVGTSESENLNQLVLYNDKFLLTGHTGNQLVIDLDTINSAEIDGVSFILKSKIDGSLEWIRELSSSNLETFVSGSYPLNNRNLIIPFSETKNLIYGNFIPEITGSSQSYQSRSQDLYTAILDEDCINNEFTIGSDLELFLCPNETIEINLPIPTTADSYTIDLLEGDVTFEFSNDLLKISEFESQYGRLQLFVENCRTEAFQSIILYKKQKPDPPVISSDLIWCASDIENASLSVVGENIKWYSLNSLTEPLATGNEYKVTSTENLFVTQTIDGCESHSTVVNIEVETVPEPPKIYKDQYEACLNTELIIDLSPNQYNWYDSNMTFLKASSSINITLENVGKHNYFITTKGILCESLPTSLSVEAVDYDLDDVFISNVITANGDGMNEYFSLESFKSEVCLGKFEYIKVINRSGILIYESRDREFKWYGVNQPFGVYYYIIKFQNSEFKGPITILK